MPYAKIHIENLGPIREGTFELRPLTIFIGPNNSGKTYAATAAYAMVNALRFDRQFRSQDIDGQRFRLQGVDYVTLERDSIHDGRRLPAEIESQVRSQLQAIQVQAIDDISSGFLDAFGTENLASLRLRGLGNLTVSIVSGLPAVDAFIVIADQIKTRASSDPDIGDASRITYDFADPDDGTRLHDGLWADVIAKQLWSDELNRLGLPIGSARYLPAGRLGIIEGWPLLAALAVGTLRQRFGRSRRELAPLSGVFAEFLQSLLGTQTGNLLRPDFPSHFQAAGGLLEDKVLGGRIIQDASSAGFTSLIYQTNDDAIPLQQASSMVADLAPLAIWIKDHLSLGDLLILDEPEAHLHPANERRVARVLARLANAGVRVLIPTHSSTIVHQVSNMVQARLLTTEQRQKIGISEEDVLSPDDVAIYQFVPGPDGVVIREIEYDPEFGYAEEGFYEVAEAISDESFEIESRLPVAAQ